jgi:hypothetical protein
MEEWQYLQIHSLKIYSKRNKFPAAGFYIHKMGFRAGNAQGIVDHPLSPEHELIAPGPPSVQIRSGPLPFYNIRAKM